MSKTWTQILLFLSLAVSGCCVFIVVGQVAPWALWIAFIALAATTLPDSLGRKVIPLWAIAAICWLIFIIVKVM